MGKNVIEKQESFWMGDPFGGTGVMDHGENKTSLFT